MKFLRLLQILPVVCLSFASPSFAKDTSVAAKHTAWRIQGDKCTVHLLGSLHLMKEESYPLPAVFEHAFTNASIVVFETDIGEMMKPATQFKLMSKGSLPEGRTLKDELSAETYKAFAAHLQSNGLPEMVFTRLRPGMAATMFTMIEIQKWGFSPENGMDIHFFKRTKDEGKSVRGLESLDFQLSLLFDLSKDEGEAFIKSTMEDMKEGKAKFHELIQAWEKGDDAALEKLLNEARKEQPAVMKRFLTDRNLKWAPQISELLKGTNNVVVIVGAGHLVGKDGVVELLKQKGCKITQE